MKSEKISREEWAELLNHVYGTVSNDPKCAPILRDIGRIRFQLRLTDRPDLSFWEEYLGNRVVPHLGSAPDRTVEAATTFGLFVGTLLREISVMEAAADEAWELRGDTEALFRCANLLPYVMIAFTDSVQMRLPRIREVAND